MTILSTRRSKQSPTHKIHTLSQLFSKAPLNEDYSQSFQKMLDDSEKASLIFKDKRGQHWEIVQKKSDDVPPPLQNHQAESSEEDYNDEDEEEEEEEYDSECEQTPPNIA